mgnify:CR=1 FL=1
MSSEQAKQGNQASRRFEQALSKADRALQVFERCQQGYEVAGVVVTRVSIKLPNDPMGEALVIINAETAEGVSLVAFHAASSFPEAVVGAAMRLNGGKLKWREDEYA